MPSQPHQPNEGDFTNRPWWRRWFGRRSERAAARYLKSLGYRLLGSNILDSAGELDLIALDRNSPVGPMLVIVEVRSTASILPADLDQTAASVDLRKQRKIAGAALRFLNRRRLLGSIAVRFDVLVVGWAAEARHPVIQHITNAFESPDRYQFHS